MCWKTWARNGRGQPAPYGYALAATMSCHERASPSGRFDACAMSAPIGEDKTGIPPSRIRAKGFGPEVKKRILLKPIALSAGTMPYYSRP